MRSGCSKQIPPNQIARSIGDAPVRGVVPMLVLGPLGGGCLLNSGFGTLFRFLEKVCRFVLLHGASPLFPLCSVFVCAIFCLCNIGHKETAKAPIIRC